MTTLVQSLSEFLRERMVENSSDFTSVSVPDYVCTCKKILLEKARKYGEPVYLFSNEYATDWYDDILEQIRETAKQCKMIFFVDSESDCISDELKKSIAACENMEIITVTQVDFHRPFIISGTESVCYLSDDYLLSSDKSCFDETCLDFTMFSTRPFRKPKTHQEYAECVRRKHPFVTISFNRKAIIYKLLSNLKTEDDVYVSEVLGIQSPHHNWYSIETSM